MNIFSTGFLSDAQRIGTGDTVYLLGCYADLVSGMKGKVTGKGELRGSFNVLFDGRKVVSRYVPKRLLVKRTSPLPPSKGEFKK